MSQSQSIKEIASALVGFHKEVRKVSKDSDNPFFKSKYASLENILDAVSGPLANNGLVIVQTPVEAGLSTNLIHVSGEWIGDTCTMATKNPNDPQAMGSAITYYRRYAIASVLCLNIGDDDDGNAAAQEKPKAKEDDIPDGNHTVTILEERHGEKAGKPWQRVKTGDGAAWVSAMDGILLQAGSTYEVSVRKGTISQARIQEEFDMSGIESMMEES